jgi:nicotinamidase-related amidase
MQWIWKASRKRALIKNIHKKVLQYRENKDLIIFVEYHSAKDAIDDSYGRTIKKLRKAVVGYYNYALVVKTEKDGSENLVEFFEENDIYPTEFEVCGVQTSACVYETVVNLAELFTNMFFKMVKDCLNDSKGLEELEDEAMEHFYDAPQFMVI